AMAVEPNRSITVTGVGTASVTPDAVRISASVSSLSATNKDALSQASTAASSVRDFLKKSGISTKDYKTSSLSVYPEYNYTQDKGSVLVGYRATQSFSITIRKADSAGSIVDGVVASGGDAVQINNVVPFLTSGTASTEQARAAAVADAKARANSYAKLLGVKLGRVITISEVSAPIYTFPSVAADKVSTMASTQIDFGEQDVTVTITVNWSLG
ncbi:MAG: DUF541 domain-containing protein, partial [Alphaproteobacteria bacterium]|nr:DUF541 domain-containing protein [Alphaproteobacteria bacterium]